MLQNKAGNPRARPIFATLDPNTLPITNSEYPPKADIIPTTNSGKDVPIATTVNPITKSENLNFLAIALAALINHSDPTNQMAEPRAKKNKLDAISITHFH